jgi:hypothetical protein
MDGDGQQKVPVVEVNGFVIKDCVTGLDMSFFKKVVTHKGLKFITKYKIQYLYSK